MYDVTCPDRALSNAFRTNRHEGHDAYGITPENTYCEACDVT